MRLASLRCLPTLRPWLAASLWTAASVIAHAGPPTPPPAVSGEVTVLRPIPISLDAVLRMAEERNGQIALAREKVCEAYAVKDVAAYAWLPDFNVGTAWYRHEGGIQNEDGTLTHASSGALFSGVDVYGKLDVREAIFRRVNAERQVWQNKGELSQVTTETLLDAASTYIDLLSARSGEAAAADLEKKLGDLLKQAQDLARDEQGLRFLVEGLQSGVNGQQQSRIKLHQQGNAAAAKLGWLLGLGACVELEPVDGKLVPIDLVDATPPCCDLVARATTTGPGMHELEGLLAALNDGYQQATGPSRFLPVFEMRVAEGLFGAGPGSSLSFDNRFDLGLQARWSLTGLLTAKDQQRVARSKLRQVHLTINELKAKLSAGVQEARDASLAGKEQVRLANDQVQHAGEAYRLSNLRYKEKVPGSSPSEVVQAIISLGSAEANYLMAVNVYDKAQLRLMLLLGAGNCHPPAVEAVVPETVTPAVHKEIVPAAPAAAPVQVAPHGATGARAPALEALRGAEMQYGKK